MEFIEVEFLPTDEVNCQTSFCCTNRRNDFQTLAKSVFQNDRIVWGLLFDCAPREWECLRRWKNCEWLATVLSAHCCHAASGKCIGKSCGKRSTEFQSNESNAKIHSGDSYDRFPLLATLIILHRILGSLFASLNPGECVSVSVCTCLHTAVDKSISMYWSIIHSFVRSFQWQVTPFRLWKRIS